jgi:hypothetical protein
MTRYTDLCPECVRKAEGIVGESRRIIDPQYLEESESANDHEVARSDDVDPLPELAQESPVGLSLDLQN